MSPDMKLLYAAEDHRVLSNAAVTAAGAGVYVSETVSACRACRWSSSPNHLTDSCRTDMP